MPIEELVRGLVAGAVAVMTVAGGRLVSRRQGRAITFEVGLPLVAATLVALVPSGSVSGWTLVGVAGVAAVSTSHATRRSFVVHAAALAPFATVLALDAPGEPWVRVLVAAAASAGAVLAARTGALAGWAPLVPALFALTAAGVLVAVPDTEEAATLFGATAVVTLFAWPAGRVRIDPAGAAAATALVAWVVAVGGRGRPPSIAASLASLGLLAAAPVGHRLRRSLVARPARSARRWGAGVLAAHALLVLVLARTAGISDQLAIAVTLALGGAIAAVASACLLDLRAPDLRGHAGLAPPTIRRPSSGPTR